jgi:hypothetical protein
MFHIKKARGSNNNKKAVGDSFFILFFGETFIYKSLF